MIKKILSLIKMGEGLNIEFKESKNALNKDIYETICSFLNRAGGELLLGVDDRGKIIGIDKNYVEKLKKEFVTVMNNKNKINPPYYLDIIDYEIDGNTVLYIAVPESSQVHRCSGKIFDRNNDSDIDITDNTNQVAMLYQRKQLTHFENTIFQFVTIQNLRKDLINSARKRAILRNNTHPWAKMNDEELLKSAGLYGIDYKNNIEGYNLACILLFGKDETIGSIIPYNKVDAILRKVNIDRYDDRDDIRTNLLDTYDRLSAFIAKHLDDPFYLEGDIRISIRNKIFREVISNILIHRDYANPFPTKLVIGKDEIYTENANKPHGFGLIDPNNFSPYPKNPIIAKMFKEIGLVDELGSGVRNIYKYSKKYFGSEPKLLEDGIFKIIFKVDKFNTQVTTQVTTQVELTQNQILVLKFCNVPRKREEIQAQLNMSNREHFRKSIISPLLEYGFLNMTIPDKPKSSKQKYKISEEGYKFISNFT